MYGMRPRMSNRVMTIQPSHAKASMALSKLHTLELTQLDRSGYIDYDAG